MKTSNNFAFWGHTLSRLWLSVQKVSASMCFRFSFSVTWLGGGVAPCTNAAQSASKLSMATTYMLSPWFIRPALKEFDVYRCWATMKDSNARKACNAGCNVD